MYATLQASIDTIPSNWRVRRFRFAAHNKSQKNTASLPLLSVSAANGVSLRDEGGLGRQAPAEETISSYWVANPGDIIINPMWAIEGGIAMSSLQGAVSPAYRVYGPADDVNPRFLHHLLRSRPYLEQYKQLIRGTTTFDRSISKEDFADLPVILPSLEEQRRIADFLDAETARIDEAVEVMRRQSGLLAERRHHIINLSLKWAGDASRFRLGYATTLVTSGSRGWGDYASTSGALFFRSANLYPDSIQPKLSSVTYVSLPEETKVEATRSRIQIGDVLVGITGANAGWVARADEDVAGGYVSQHVCLTRPEAHKVDSEWLAFLIASPSTQRVLMGSQYGGTKTQLSLPDIRGIHIPSISLTRQREIAREVKRQVNLIDRQRHLRGRQVELLGERRQALITAAVTGQFDVSTASGRGVTE